MASIQHSALTDPNIHEPKGITTASAGQIYVADGSSSGDWTAIQDTYTAVISDVSTASTVHVPVHSACTVTKIVTVLSGAIDIADAVITAKNAAGTSMGTITVAFTGSAAGDIDTLSPASNNSIAANSFLTVETNGASTNTETLYVTILTSRTA